MIAICFGVQTSKDRLFHGAYRVASRMRSHELSIKRNLLLGGPGAKTISHSRGFARVWGVAVCDLVARSNCVNFKENRIDTGLQILLFFLHKIKVSIMLRSLLITALAGVAFAHGDHGSRPGGGGSSSDGPKEYPNWMSRHMAGEHETDCGCAE